MSDVDICDRTFKFALRIIKLCDFLNQKPVALLQFKIINSKFKKGDHLIS